MDGCNAQDIGFNVTGIGKCIPLISYQVFGM